MTKKTGGTRSGPRTKKATATQPTRRARAVSFSLPDIEVHIPEPISVRRADVITDDDIQFGPVFVDPETVQGVGKAWYPVAHGGAMWDCPYGCPGRSYVADGIEGHVWNCPWWDREGKTQTPFDRHEAK